LGIFLFQGEVRQNFLYKLRSLLHCKNALRMAPQQMFAWPFFPPKGQVFSVGTNRHGLVPIFLEAVMVPTVIYLERPDALCEAKRCEFDLWKSQRLSPDGETPWLTIAKARTEADELLKEDPENRIITELIAWLQTMMPTAKPSPNPPQKSIWASLPAATLISEPLPAG